MGISAGRNAGIAAAAGEIIFCLDSDATLGANSLQNMVDKFQADPKIGVINSKIVNAFSGVLDGGPGWAYSEKQKSMQDAEFLSWTFSEGGAAIRKEVFERVGLFWERLFFGCEGQDFALRVWDAGYQVVYFPSSIVFHRASEHKRVANRERETQFFRNTLYIYLVRYPWWMLAFMAPLKIGAVKLRFAKRGYLPAAFKVLWEVMQKLPVLLKERKPVKSSTARLYLKLLRQQGPLSWDVVSWLKFKT
jgi:GT2 family glycosyltransferase